MEREKQCLLRCISNACEEKLCCGQPKQEQKNLKYNDGIKRIKSGHITEITEQQSSIDSVDKENRPDFSFTSSTQETKETSASANVAVPDTVSTHLSNSVPLTTTASTPEKNSDRDSNIDKKDLAK